MMYFIHEYYSSSSHVYLIFSILQYFLYLFFFSSRRRHTRSLRDWSSDVCSSDLDHRSELQGLEGSVARRVCNTVLCPADDFTAVVHRRGIAVEPSWKWRKRRHLTVRPSKALTYFPGWGPRSEETVARKIICRLLTLIRV